MIVETETPIKTEDMANGESSSQSGGGAGSGSSGANDQQNYALALNEDENQQVRGGHFFCWYVHNFRELLKAKLFELVR